MRNKIKGPRGAAIVFLCIALAAMWLIAVYGTYEDSKREKYEVRITPGAVSYGTHSTALMPMAVAPARTSVPMVSANAVHSYAHHGHASAPTVSSGKGLYTTSSARVKTIGSGNGGGGWATGSSPSSSSQRGISYSSGSVSMPSLAMNSSMLTTTSAAQKNAQETATRYGIGPRRVKPTDSGTDGEWRYGGNTPEDPDDWWYYDDYAGDDGDWIQVSDGDTRNDPDVSGKYWTYDASTHTWYESDDKGNPVSTPMGETPWIIMILLACAYALTTLYRKYKKTA